MALSPKLAVNKKAALTLLLISLIAPCILKIQPGKAAPETIIVPDDYPTITEAIGNATDGDTIFVKKGTYEEPSLVITKTLSLIGEDKNSTIIKDSDASISTINATIRIVANDVKVAGFTITGGVKGIEGKGDRIRIIDDIIIAEQRITLEGSNNTIAQNILKSLDNNDELLSPTGVSFGVGYGILCFGSYNDIFTNEFSGPSLESVILGGDSSFNVVYGNTINDSGFMKVFGNRNIIVGNIMTGSSVGVWVYTGSNNVVYANRITNGIGISISSGYENTLFANHVTNCRSGVSIERLQSYPDYEKGPWTMNNTFYNNNFVNNDHQVTGGGTNFWDNGNEGNFWSDYNGIDADGDGVGDTPYIIDETSRDNFPLMAPFDVSSVTVELPEWASSPSSSPPSTDMKPLPTALLVAVAIIACVFGFGLIVNLLTAKKKKH